MSALTGTGWFTGALLGFWAMFTLCTALVVWLMAYFLERALDPLPMPRSRLGRFARWALHQGLAWAVVLGLIVGVLGLWFATWL